MDTAPPHSLWKQGLTQLQAHVRRHRWAWGVGIVLLAVYAVAAAIWVPRVLRTLATDYVGTTLHRQLTLGEVRFNPLTLTLSVDQVALAEADGAPIFSARDVRANLELWSSLLHGAAVVKEIALQSPQVHAMVLRNGQLNLAQLVPASAPDDDAAPKALPPVRITRLVVREGRIHFEDRSHARLFKTQVGPINFALDDFQTLAGHENAYRLSLQLSPQEKIQWSGEFSLQPLASHGQFKIAGLQMRTLTDWWQSAQPDTLPVQPLGGELDLEGHYALRLDKDLSLTAELPSVTLRQLALALRSPESASAEAAEPAAWLRVPEIRLSKTRFSLADQALQVQGLSVQGAQLQIQRDAAGRIQPWQAVQDALQRASHNAATLSSAKPAATVMKGTKASKARVAAPRPWRVGVQEISFAEGQLNFSDVSTQPSVQWTLAPINLSLNDYRSDAPRTAMAVQASVGVWKGQVSAEGSVQLEPLSVQAQVKVSDLDLTALQPYVAQRLSLDLRSALLAGQVQLQYGATSQPRLLVRGDAQLSQVETRDHELGQPLLGWQALQLSGLEFQQGPDRWKIDQVRVRRPYARVAIAANGSLNVTRALHRPGPGATPAASGEATPTMPGQIREILMEDGTADFSDQSLKPTFAAGIYQLRGSVTGLSTEVISRAQVRLEGSVDRYAPVTIAGDLNVLASVRSSDLRLRFANMDLTTFNPYATKYVGYPIERGKLTTELRYQLSNRQLDAQHHVTLDQLSFGPATDSPDAVSLPVKLAVAVLQDSRGVIELDLPVTGSLDDPDFRVGPLVWKAFEGLLRRVVTAPFAMLGALFGSEDELQVVEFAPGTSELDAAQLDKLDKLTQALKEHPLLRLNVPLGVTDERDSPLLAQQNLNEAISPVPADPEAHLAVLTTLYTRKVGAAPQWPAELGFRLGESATDRAKARSAWLTQQLLPRYAASAGDRDALARARAETVRRRLIEQGKVAAERIFLVTEGPMNADGSNAVRMELKLD